jgi:hypothetical protein
MTEYNGPDEYPIKSIPDTPMWSENFAAMFTDTGSEIAVMYSTGRWHGDPTLWREFVMVSFADGRFLFHRGYGRNGDERGPGGSLAKYDILEPGRSVKLHFDGPMSETNSEHLLCNSPQNEPPAKRCIMDLQFDSMLPVWNMKGDSAEASTMAGGIHIDHIGTSSGRICYDGQEYEFRKGYSVRDHSRGVRDMSHFGGHCWINGSFDDGRSFCVYAMRAQGMNALGMSNACVIENGELFPATLKHCDLITKVGQSGAGHSVVLDYQGGQMEINITAVTNKFPYSMLVPFDTALGVVDHRPAAYLIDEFVRMECNGISGVGWSERGFAPNPLATI